jgi:hypothetical protein
MVGCLPQVLVVEIQAEADEVAVAEAEGWGPQVAARAHCRFEQGFAVVVTRGEFEDLFAFGDDDLVTLGKDLPGFVGADPFLAGVDGFADLDIVAAEELPGFFTGGSALAHIGPVDGHDCGSFEFGFSVYYVYSVVFSAIFAYVAVSHLWNHVEATHI